MQAWVPPERSVPKGYLERYSQLVTSAGTGAVFAGSGTKEGR